MECVNCYLCNGKGTKLAVWFVSGVFHYSWPILQCTLFRLRSIEWMRLKEDLATKSKPRAKAACRAPACMLYVLSVCGRCRSAVCTTPACAPPPPHTHTHTSQDCCIDLFVFIDPRRWRIHTRHHRFALWSVSVDAASRSRRRRRWRRHCWWNCNTTCRCSGPCGGVCCLGHFKKYLWWRWWWWWPHCVISN